MCRDVGAAPPRLVQRPRRWSGAAVTQGLKPQRRRASWIWGQHPGPGCLSVGWASPRGLPCVPISSSDEDARRVGSGPPGPGVKTESPLHGPALQIQPRSEVWGPGHRHIWGDTVWHATSPRPGASRAAAGGSRKHLPVALHLAAPVTPAPGRVLERAPRHVPSQPPSWRPRLRPAPAWTCPLFPAVLRGAMWLWRPCSPITVPFGGPCLPGRDEG